jgi:hypothetical protein
MNTEPDHFPIPVARFRSLWLLAGAFGHHWAGALGTPLPIDAVDAHGVHPYAGVPAPPGRAQAWTNALIHAMAAVSPTGPCGGIMCPPQDGEEHVSTTRRLVWAVDGAGRVSIRICRPASADCAGFGYTAVLIAHVSAEGEFSLWGDWKGHCQGHKTLGPEGRHVFALAEALGALGIHDPISAIEAQAREGLAQIEAALVSRDYYGRDTRDEWQAVVAACAEARAAQHEATP